MTDILAVARPARPAQRRARSPWAALAVVLAGQFMAVLDASVVNVAAPSIHASLHTSGAGLQLVIAGYVITYAVLLVTGARLGDILGHRRLFLSGLAAFTLASLGCGLATSTAVLVTLRFIQGAGAAAMIPQVLSLIQRTFTGAARGRPMRLYAAVLAGGAVTGQVVGGVLVSADLLGSTWRPVFLLNVPIGAILFLAGLRTLPAGRGEPGRGLDLAGVATLTPAVLALILPLVLGQSEHWPAWGWACLAASGVLFALFAVVERRAAAAGGAPLIPGRLLRLPGTAAGIAALFCVMAVFGGFFFVLALHLQGGLGDSPMRAGLTFAPAGLAFALVSLNWQRLPAHRHVTVSIAGFVIYGAGLLMLAALLRGGGPGGAGLLAGLALMGAGMAAAFSPLMTAVVTRVPVTDAADATGVIVTVNQLALVVGVATFGTLYLNLAGRLPQDPAAGFRLVSAHAVAVTCAVLAAGAVVGGILAALRTRTDR
jgi:MFS family permease